MNKKSDQAGETRPWGPSRSSAWWTITTAVAVAVILGLGVLDLIRLLVLPIGIFIFGLTLAASLAPLVAWLERWIPRVPAAVLVYIGLVLLLATLTWGVVPSLVSQVQALGNRLPNLIERAQDFLDRWGGGESGASLANTLYSQLERIGPALLRLPLTLASVVSGILLVLFISFYILLEASRMESFILSLFPKARREHIDHVLVEVAQAMGRLLGALIAIPITAALRLLIRLVIAPAIRRQTGAESVERSAD